MKMTAFKIENYRCILDSGWVETDDIAVIVGKNESGKTSLLKALWKFNPFHQAPYSLDREWPRGKRKERSDDKVVATVRFAFTPEEISGIGAVHESAKGIEGVEIKRNYKGSYLYSFLPRDPNAEHDIKWVISLLQERLAVPPERSQPNFKTQYQEAFSSYVEGVRDNGGCRYAVEKAADLKQQLSSFASHPHDNEAVQQLRKTIDATVAEIEATPLRRVIDTVHAWLPTFIYMDDYRIFSGSAQLDDVKQRRDHKNATAEDETIVLIMEMAGLDLEEEVKKGNADDREQRILDMNDASQTLTREIAERWSQKKYEVMFQADGQHFITFVKDLDGKVLVPLEERSKGFQWFFSFDMTFMYETKGKFENAIILLDEPGLHLHAAAQRDLLGRMKAYAATNQLIYSTHLPFMIDFTRLDNIFVAEDMPGKGVVVHKDWATADKDARFTLQAALGLSWSQSLFVGQFNLVVEGVTDFWYLTTISEMLKEAGEAGLDDQLVVTPAGGASKVAYVGTILHGQNLNVAVLLDSDPEGKTAYEQLVHQWIMDAKHVLRLGDVLGVERPLTLEDLFSDDYFVAHVAAAYEKELGRKVLKVALDTSTPILERVERALKDKGIERFNKGRVSKRIMLDLAGKKLPDVAAETADKFRRVIAAVNGIVAEWKQRQ